MADENNKINPNRTLEEFAKRKASLEDKHEAELNALKIRQNREIEALEARYSYLNVSEKKNSSVH